MTFEGLREMFEGDSADKHTGKFSLVLMEGLVEGLVCTDPGARTKNDLVGYYTPLMLRRSLL